MRVKGVRGKFGDNFLVEAHRKGRRNRGILVPLTNNHKYITVRLLLRLLHRGNIAFGKNFHSYVESNSERY